MIASVSQIKEKLIRTLDELLPEQITELLDFASYLRDRKEQIVLVPLETPFELRLVPMTTLNSLSGIVSLGGDALADSEALYDEPANSD